LVRRKTNQRIRGLARAVGVVANQRHVAAGGERGEALGGHVATVTVTAPAFVTPAVF